MDRDILEAKRDIVNAIMTLRGRYLCPPSLRISMVRSTRLFIAQQMTDGDGIPWRAIERSR